MYSFFFLRNFLEVIGQTEADVSETQNSSSVDPTTMENNFTTDGQEDHLVSVTQLASEVKTNFLPFIYCYSEQQRLQYTPPISTTPHTQHSIPHTLISHLH